MVKGVYDILAAPDQWLYVRGCYYSYSLYPREMWKMVRNHFYEYTKLSTRIVRYDMGKATVFRVIWNYDDRPLADTEPGETREVQEAFHYKYDEEGLVIPLPTNLYYEPSLTYFIQDNAIKCTRLKNAD